MNKTELIQHIAMEAGISKDAAGRALDAALHAIQRRLQQGREVQIIGFGKFSAVKRAARTGVNPRTGEPLKIKARKVPKFTPGQRLREALNGGAA